MLLARALIAFVLLGLSGASRSEVAAQIRLLPRAEVATRYFTLSDVADIESANSELQQRLTALRIGQSPRTGYRVTIARAAVEDAVSRGLPALRGALRWSGAARVDVHAGGQRVSFERVADIAASAALEAMRPAYQGLDLQPVGKLEDLSVPQGSVGLAPRVDHLKSATRRWCVPVDLTIDGQAYRTIYVWFSVRAMQKVWVARQPRAAGEPLQEADFRSDVHDVAALSSAPVNLHAEPLRTLRLRRPIDAGRPLLSAQVETRPAVLRNEPVAVKLISGAISIETNGVALDDARVGQYVRVRNSASGEAFSARVVAQQSVVIEGR